MEILHVHTKGGKLETLEQPERYKNTKTWIQLLNKQNRLNSVYSLKILQHRTHKTSLNNSTNSNTGTGQRF